MTAKKKAPGAKRPMVARRADYGAPVDAFFRKKDRPLLDVLLALREIVEKAVPDATASIKWGMPVYAVNGRNFASLGGHKAHVNLVLWGEPLTFDDPKGLLAGDGPAGRVLRMTQLADLPKADARRWIEAAAALAREKSRR